MNHAVQNCRQAIRFKGKELVEESAEKSTSFNLSKLDVAAAFKSEAAVPQSADFSACKASVGRVFVQGKSGHRTIIGTAFTMSGEIFTAKHVLEDCLSYEPEQIGIIWYSATADSFVTSYAMTGPNSANRRREDYCRLRIKGPKPKSLKPAPESVFDEQAIRPCAAIGHSDNDTVECHSGQLKLKLYPGQTYAHSASTTQGTSGGPVLIGHQSHPVVVGIHIGIYQEMNRFIRLPPLDEKVNWVPLFKKESKDKKKTHKGKKNKIKKESTPKVNTEEAEIQRIVQLCLKEASAAKEKLKHDTARSMTPSVGQGNDEASSADKGEAGSSANSQAATRATAIVQAISQMLSDSSLEL
jgi:hypothetical protein